ncbi:hypothetical protein [Clostridium sp.]|uniref:hypothetical protein n=1 Tax=Clostridium sp. TaxID=1506 RepID=UPI003D6D6072
MIASNYIETLSIKYNKNFNVSVDVSLCEKRINLFAEHNGIGGRTFITQKDIIDRFEFNEYCVVNVYNSINREEVSEYTEYLKTLVTALVKPHREHKSSTITGVIVCNTSIDKSTKKFIKKFKYTKSYKLYFHGWSDIRLILVDLSNNLVIPNKRANSVKKVYIPTSLNK